jgi:hypothetical protein
VKRIVQPELLDTLPPDDPRAIRSRRDLSRINWWMRNHAIMARALQTHLSAVPEQLIELGAGDGNFLRSVVQRLSPCWPDAEVTLLDRQKNVSAETLSSFAELGWRATAVVADALDWSPRPGSEPVVVANMFLHHFAEEKLSELLDKISRRSRLFVAIEPHRFSRALPFGQLLWLIGCNGVTRHDAVVSIRAGFAGEEISALWPDKTNWQLTERRAGLFSHLFIARWRE